MAETATRTAALFPPLTRQRWVVIAVCCLATCARQLEPPLWVFHPPPTSAFNAGWVEFNLLTSVISLSTLGFILVGGVLGDLFGRRRVLLIGLGGILFANLLLALSPALPWFLATRMLAAAFGALVLPLSLSLLTVAFDEDARARAGAIAVYIVVTTSAFFLSMLLGQVMYSLFDYRAAFAASTLLALVAFPLVRRHLTESRMERWRRFDAVGHAAWALTLLSITYGLALWRVAGPHTVLILIAAVVGGGVGLALLIWWDSRWWGDQEHDSILEQGAMPRGQLAILIAYGVAMQFGNVGYATQVRGALINAYGYGAVLGTLALAPLLLGMTAMVVFGTRRLAGRRVRPTLAACLAVAGAVSALTALTRAAGFFPWLAVLLAAFGAVMVACNTAWTFVLLRSITDAMIGVRTGITSAIYMLGGAAGGTVAGALLAGFGLADSERLLQAQGASPEQTASALAAMGVLLDPGAPDPATLDPAIAAQLLAGHELIYIASFERVLLIVAAVCLVGAAVAWFGLQARDEGEEVMLARD